MTDRFENATGGYTSHSQLLLGGTARRGVSGKKSSFHPERRDKIKTGIPRAGDRPESRQLMWKMRLRRRNLKM